MKSMTMERVTVTIEQADLAAIRELVAEGHADTVSGFIQHAVSLALSDEHLFARELAEMLEATGGPLTETESQWALHALGVETT